MVAVVNKNKNRSPKSVKARKKRLALLAVSAALLLAGGTAAWAATKNPSPTLSTANTDNAAGPDITPQAQQPADSTDPNSDADDLKKNTSPEPASSNGSSMKSVKPTITYASQEGNEITVSAYVSGVFEEGGTCKAIFTKSSHTALSKSSKGFHNVSYTACAPIRIPRSDFPVGGSWYLKVSYKSPKAEGTSAQQSVTIQ